ETVALLRVQWRWGSTVVRLRHVLGSPQLETPYILRCAKSARGILSKKGWQYCSDQAMYTNQEAIQQHERQRGYVRPQMRSRSGSDPHRQRTPLTRGIQDRTSVWISVQPNRRAARLNERPEHTPRRSMGRA